MPADDFKNPCPWADESGVRPPVEHQRPVSRLIILFGSLTFTAAALALAWAPGGATAASKPHIGFNDNFNNFELRTTNPLDPILGPLPDGIDDLPLLPPDRTTPVVNGGELMARAREGGASVIRYVVPWARVERERGVYDWSIEDASYELALEHGVRPLIVLLTSPCWAHPSMSCEDAAQAGYSSYRPDPQFLDEFGDFARAAMERYPKAVAFEVWNEANLSAFWGPDGKPQAYVEMLRAVDRATANLDSHPPILFNGLIPHDSIKFLKRAMGRFGARNLVDGTAFHPYVGARGSVAVADRIRANRKVLRKTKGPRPMYITEVGWSTHPQAKGGVTDQQQAARISRLIDIAPKLNLKSVIIHRLRDIDRLSAWEQGLGVTTIDDQPKSVFCLLAAEHGPSDKPKGC